MGFFSKSAPSSVNKALLIRYLVLQRFKSDPVAISQGYSPGLVLQLPDEQLMGTVEAGIVTIAETFAQLSKKGTSEDEIFAGIEHHRMSLGRGKFPEPLDLKSYVAYRAALEHTGAELPIGHVSLCLAASIHFFTDHLEAGDPSRALDFAVNKQTAAELHAVMTVLTKYFDGDIDDDNFYEFVATAVESWKATHPPVSPYNSDFREII